MYYPGCMILSEQYQYEISAKKILDYFNVKYEDIPEFHCCGEPLKCVNVSTWLTMAARIIAMAEDKGRDVLVLCNGCYLSLNKARKYLLNDSRRFKEVNSILSREGLEFRGTAKIKHIVNILVEDIGVDKIKQSVKRQINIKVATHYGCHVLRPYEFSIDPDPENPTILEKLLNAIGAKAPYYPERLDCCMILFGNVKHREADYLRAVKLEAIKKRGFDALVTICPLCQKSYETRQKRLKKIFKKDVFIPVVYYTQLLGLALGFSPEDMGLHLNQSPVEVLLEKLGISFQ